MDSTYRGQTSLSICRNDNHGRSYYPEDRQHGRVGEFMAFAILTFLFVFLLIASGGLILFYRQSMIQRIGTVITPHPKQGSLRGTLEHTGSTLSSIVGQFEKVVP